MVNAHHVLAVVIVITIVSLETEKGSEPRWGQLSAQSHAELGDEEGWEPDPKITHQDGTKADGSRADPGSCSGASGPRALGGLGLASVWGTVIDSDRVGGRGSGRDPVAGRVWGRTLELGRG